MSASTQDETLKLSRTRWRISGFWMVSIVLHGLVIGAVAFIAPVREIVFVRERPREPEIITYGDELERIISDIRSLAVDELRVRVGLLRDGQDRMATNFNTLNTYFQPFQEQQVATALSRLRRYADDTTTRQQLVMTALQAGRDQETYASAVSTAKENMSRILTGQDEIRRGIHLLKLSAEELVPQQQEAEELQHQALQFVRWVDDNIDAVNREQTRLATAQQSIAELEPSVGELKQAAETSEAQRIEAEERKKRLEQDRDQARKDKRDEQVRDLETQIRQANEAINTHRNAGNDRRRELQDAERKLAESQRNRDEAQKAIPEHTAKRDELARTALAVQTDARTRQQAIVQLILAKVDEVSP